MRRDDEFRTCYDECLRQMKQYGIGCGKNEQTEAESKASDNTEAVVMTETESGISAETDENAEMQSEQIETGGEDSWEDSADGWD